MKKMMILVSAIMMAATANATRIETADFSEVRVNVPARVRIVSGDSYSVNITAENKDLEGLVRYNVEDGVLRINASNLDAIRDNGSSFCITIVTPNVPKVTTGREMEAKVRRDTFNSNMDIAAND